jgi:hypothetical protein
VDFPRLVTCRVARGRSRFQRSVLASILLLPLAAQGRDQIFPGCRPTRVFRFCVAAVPGSSPRWSESPARSSFSRCEISFRQARTSVFSSGPAAVSWSRKPRHSHWKGGSLFISSCASLFAVGLSPDLVFLPTEVFIWRSFFPH